MHLSVVIPVRDGAATLDAQLGALSRSDASCAWEVLVVDDGSADATVAVARRWGDRLPSLRVVPAGPPGGLAHARNVGVAEARADAIAFCDADDEVGAGWVAAMAAALADHDYVTGPMEVEQLNPPWLAASRGRSFAALEPPTFAGLFPFAHGANIGLSRSALERLGPFPAGEPIAEDVDLGLRAHLDGVPLHFEPAAVVHYRYRGSLTGVARQSFHYGIGYVLTCAKLEAAGAATPRRFGGGRRAAWVLRSLPGLRSRADVARWVWTAASVAGRLRGSLRYRALWF